MVSDIERHAQQLQELAARASDPANKRILQDAARSLRLAGQHGHGEKPDKVPPDEAAVPTPHAVTPAPSAPRRQGGAVER